MYTRLSFQLWEVWRAEALFPWDVHSPRGVRQSNIIHRICEGDTSI